MPKRLLGATEAFDLRQALQVAVLDALVSSRRWQPGELVFQGGTSLHLAHGSPRFSEDLDFLVSAALRLDSLASAVRGRLEHAAWLPPDMKPHVGKARDGRNPHAFVVSIGDPDVIGAVRVKVELWRTDKTALSEVKAVVASVRLARGPAAGMQTFVPTAELAEIQADKVFVLAARPFLKPRDVFDLHWLSMQGRSLPPCSADDLRVRLATYPSQTPTGWLDLASARRGQLLQSVPAVASDLRRWLPSSWPLDEGSVATMVETSVAALDHGIDAMRAIEADQRGDRDNGEGPMP